MSKTGEITGSKATGGWVRRNTTTVLTLPPPAYEWAWHDLPDHVATPDPFPEGILDRQRRLKYAGVIESVGTRDVWYDSGGMARRSVWRVDERAWRFAAQEHKRKLQSDIVLPCNHVDGFETVDPSGEGVYECGWEHCDETYTRATIEEVL